LIDDHRTPQVDADVAVVIVVVVVNCFSLMIDCED
jgi:hypothetical protein